MRDNVRVLIIGAHPDDCEYHAGGLAAKYRRLGHTVKFVSLTNGDAGHQKIGGPELAKRRLQETGRVADAYGIEYEVLDIPDGYLVADLATRDKLIALIRRFRPNLIFTHRPNDYHPDHRATGTLVMDASFLMRVPNIVPDVPALDYRVIILSLQDGFTRPIPFEPNVAVAIDDVIEDKARMLHLHTSQFYEWLPFVGGYEADLPSGEADRLKFTQKRVEEGDAYMADRFRDLLIARYGEEIGKKVRCAEFFEVSEYAKPLPSDEIDQWFPR